MAADMYDLEEIHEEIEGINEVESKYHCPPQAPVPDPIVIKGQGDVLFGMSRRFNKEFPQALTGKLSPDEYAETIARLNAILEKQVNLGIKWLMFGCLCCCCTVGCSLWPAICLKQTTKKTLEKTIDYENVRLYHKINLNLRLHKKRLDNQPLSEYVLLIEFVPKINLLRPD